MGGRDSSGFSVSPMGCTCQLGRKRPEVDPEPKTASSHVVSKTGPSSSRSRVVATRRPHDLAVPVFFSQLPGNFEPSLGCSYDGRFHIFVVQLPGNFEPSQLLRTSLIIERELLKMELLKGSLYCLKENSLYRWNESRVMT